jgi:hypothetical protein
LTPLNRYRRCSGSDLGTAARLTPQMSIQAPSTWPKTSPCDCSSHSCILETGRARTGDEVRGSPAGHGLKRPCSPQHCDSCDKPSSQATMNRFLLLFQNWDRDVPHKPCVVNYYKQTSRYRCRSGPLVTGLQGCRLGWAIFTRGIAGKARLESLTPPKQCHHRCNHPPPSTTQRVTRPACAHCYLQLVSIQQHPVLISGLVDERRDVTTPCTPWDEVTFARPQH